MMLLADEGVDRQIVQRLRLDGHEVLYVAEFEPGITDEEVLARANQHKALLVTTDKDFGELVFRQKLLHGGVVLLRLAGLSSSSKASTVSTAIQEHSAAMAEAFSVISPGLVRIRKDGLDRLAAELLHQLRVTVENSPIIRSHLPPSSSLSSVNLEYVAQEANVVLAFMTCGMPLPWAAWCSGIAREPISWPSSYCSRPILDTAP